jgi:hypothetical protein
MANRSFVCLHKEFTVVSIMANDDQVVAEIVIDAVVPGGGHYRDEELHLGTFDTAGKNCAMRHYVDTAKPHRRRAWRGHHQAAVTRASGNPPDGAGASKAHRRIRSTPLPKATGRSAAMCREPNSSFDPRVVKTVNVA